MPVSGWGGRFHEGRKTARGRLSCPSSAGRTFSTYRHGQWQALPYRVHGIGARTFRRINHPDDSAICNRNLEDLILRLYGTIGMLPVGGERQRHGLPGKRDLGHFLAGLRVRETYRVAELQGVDQCAAVRRHRQAHRTLTSGNIRHTPTRHHVDNGDARAAGVRHVDRLLIRRKCRALGAETGRNEGDVAGLKIHSGKTPGVGVADEGPPAVRPKPDHVRGLTLDVVPFENRAGPGIDQQQTAGFFSGYQKVTGYRVEVDPVGAAVRTEVDGSEILVVRDVDDGDGILAVALLRHPHHAVIGHVEQALVRGQNHLMGMDADLDFGEAFPGCIIKADLAREFFIYHQACFLRRLAAAEHGCNAKQQEYLAHEKISFPVHYFTTTFTSLSGTVITLTTCLPVRYGCTFSSAMASDSSSSFGVPKGT